MREVAYALGNDFSLANAFDARLLDKSGEIYKSLYAASADDGLLDGWQPKIRIKFFHATNDDCVPVECTRKAQDAFAGNNNVRFEYDDTPAQQFLHSAMQVKFYQNVIKEIYGMNSGLWAERYSLTSISNSSWMAGGSVMLRSCIERAQPATSSPRKV